MDERDRSEIVRSVEAAMRSFETAERALDAERLIAHFADVPDFHMYNDGQRLNYGTMAAGVRAAFPTLRSIEGGFTDIRVLVLAADAALVTARFQETITDATGAEIRQQGTASWLWRKLAADWRIVYGHVDHQLLK